MTASAPAILDASLIGFEAAPSRITVEPVQLRLFLKAIGETDRFPDKTAAGDRGITIPPTYLFCLHMTAAGDGYYDFYTDRGIAIGRLLHGEHHVTYHRPVCLGDTLLFRLRIADVALKKGGALTVMVEEIRVENNTGLLVAEIRNTVVVQNDGVAA